MAIILLYSELPVDIQAIEFVGKFISCLGEVGYRIP